MFEEDKISPQEASKRIEADRRQHPSDATGLSKCYQTEGLSGSARSAVAPQIGGWMKPHVANSKTVNTRVDNVIARRDTGHKSAPGHPWRTCPSASPPTTGNALRCSKEKTGKADISIWR